MNIEHAAAVTNRKIHCVHYSNQRSFDRCDMLRLLFLLLAFTNTLAEESDPGPLKPGDLFNYPQDYCAEAESGEYWDYVVIGGGTAGAIVGRRLAELPNTRVLILEAGENPPQDSDLPSKTDQLPPTCKWQYHSKPSKTECLGMYQNKCIYNTGKALGGSSSTNFMLYTRGNPEDQNEWAALGNKGWSYQDCKPYFEKLETFAYNIYYTNKLNRTLTPHGPLTVSNFQVDPPSYRLKQSLLRAAKSLGYPDTTKEPLVSKSGFRDMLGTVDNVGYRQNTAKGYLRDIPLNLRVCKNALVDKIGFENGTGTVVEYLYKGQRRDVVVLREIIISAGPLNSPLILERSGIGNPGILKEAGVDLYRELRGVGENLQDRFLNRGVAYQVKLPLHPTSNPIGFSITSFGGFFSLNGSKTPDVQIMPFLHTFAENDYKIPISTQYAIASFHNNILFFAPILLRQETTGSVHIRTSSPKAEPVIVPRQFASKADVAKMVEAMRKAMKIVEHDELLQFQPKFVRLDECKRHRFMSDTYLECLTRVAAATIGEVVGTCKMGADGDKFAVVDHNLRVRGVKNVRVIDASVMPTIPRGNILVPTAMVAEKGAEIVKRAYMG